MPSKFFNFFNSLAVLTVQLSGVFGTSFAIADEPISFSRDIRPILNAHCVECHGGVKQAGGVSFVYRDQVIGNIVEPGDPDSSSLYERIIETDPELRMPPADHGKALNDLEIRLIQRWIQQGAKWNAHWAYEAPTRQVAPQVTKRSWPRNRIDQFILRRMELKNLQPSVDARPELWLRRATLDITGLPPTLDERDAFLNAYEKDPQQAREEVVDRLLDSPSFGEHWASMWLDQVRYADSKGLGADGRRNIWKYRDWVIRSFNDDLPYDQFTINQIAGDLKTQPGINDYVATAVHRLTQTNEEGGTDDEEFRIAAVLDRVNTTWQAWQGVTFGCVQCHAHPYDPFRHQEYYQFAAFFNNTADCDLGEDLPLIQAPLNPKDNLKAEQLDRQIESIQTKIWEQEYALLSDTKAWTGLKHLSAKSSNKTKVEIESKEHHDEYFTIGTVTRNTDFVLEAPLPESTKQISAIRLTLLPLNPNQALADSEWGFTLSHITVELLNSEGAEANPIEISRLMIDEPRPLLDPQQSLNPKLNRGFSAYTRIHYPRQVALVLKEPIEASAKTRLRVTLKHRIHILASFSLIARRGHIAITGDRRFSELEKDQDQNKRRKRLASLKSERAKIKSTSVPVLMERPSHLQRPTHLFIRGLFLTKGKQVSADIPRSLPAIPQNQKKDRMALAQWLVSSKNPLTSRVAVNRVWARVFGAGLVLTEEDFGSSGEAPSHPMLLDDLAFRFQHNMNWSHKKLIRELILSRTYGQSASRTGKLAMRDPHNRLLTRGPRFRMSAEMIRDQALAISGLLSRKQFGPPVHPTIPAGVWRPFSGGDKWQTPEKGSENRYRRSVYTYTKRSIPFPMSASFDAPSREFCTPRRLRSNTPIQALMTLNDQTYVECAAAFANWMRDQATTTQEQIRLGFVKATCRQPNQEELNELVALHQKLVDSNEQNELEAIALVLLNVDEVFMK